MTMNSKTKLLIVTDYFYPHWTGISKSFYFLVQMLHNDLDITVLTVQFRNDLSQVSSMGNNVEIIRTKKSFTVSRAIFSLHLLTKLYKIGHSYDGILLNCPSIHMFPVAFLTKLMGKRLYVFHQGDIMLPKGFVNKIVEIAFDMSSLLTFALADKVSTYTKDYANHTRVLRLFKKKFTPLLMPFMVNSNIDNKSNLYKQIVALKKTNNNLFGFAGRFVEEKGFDVLFDAIPMIIKQMPSVHFLFAGDVHIPYENFYQKNQERLNKVKKYITFLGLLSDHELASFYTLCDFILLPSRSDCFPLVQAESMLYGTPVIVSNIPGARVLVKKTGFGLLCEKENPEDLARTIINAILEKKNIMENYKNVANILDYKKNAQAIKRFIEE